MNLIYDRTQSDVDNAIAIRSKYQALGDWSGITEDEIAQLKRGTYSCFDDMNRVDAAVRELGGMLTAAGYPVRYTSPIPKPEKPLTNFTLKSDDFQQAPYLYATGEHDTQYADDYISTKVMIDVSASQKIYITTNVALLQDSGFVWYDKNRQFISGAKSEDISEYSMSATPPQNARYCNININSTGIIPNNIQNVNVIYNGADDYIELTYIQSSGTQYIDTGYKPNSNTRVVCKIFGMNTSHGSEAVFGARTSTSSTDKYVFLVTDNANYRTDYGNNNAEFAKSVNFTGEFEIDKNKNVTILNKTTQISNSAYTFNSTLNLYLFASNTGGTAGTLADGMGTIYCQIYDNNVLVRDYIPAIQNGRTGLYDKAESKMYYSNGTDDFIAGDIVAIPSEPNPEPEITEFEPGDIISYETWYLYLSNVQAIRDAYYTMADTPSLPEPTAPLNFDGANAIEKLIYDVRVLYNAMSASYRKCGTFQAGVNVKRLPLQRSVT